MGTVALRRDADPPTARRCAECPPAQSSHSRWDFAIPTSTVRSSPSLPAPGTHHPACCPARSPVPISSPAHRSPSFLQNAKRWADALTRRRRRTDPAGRQSRRPLLGGRVSADGRVGVRPLTHRGARWGANGEQTYALNGPELHSTALNGTAPTCGSYISAGRRIMASLVHTEEVAGSIPASPTIVTSPGQTASRSCLVDLQRLAVG